MLRRVTQQVTRGLSTNGARASVARQQRANVAALKKVHDSQQQQKEKQKNLDKLSGEVLSLNPRFADRDRVVVDNSFPSFRELREEETRKGEKTSNSLLRSPDLALHELDEEELSYVLDTALKSNKPRAVVHILSQIGQGLQLPVQMSRLVLKMVRQMGDEQNLRELRRLLQPIVPSLSSSSAESSSLASSTLAPKSPHVPILRLELEDVNDTISLCVQRGDCQEAMLWLLTMQDVLHIAPSDLTYSLLLPLSAKEESWECLFYLLGEMRISGIPVSKRIHELLIKECERFPRSRWQYARKFLENASSDDAEAAAVEQGAICKMATSAIMTMLKANQVQEALLVWHKHVAMLAKSKDAESLLLPVSIAAIRAKNEEVFFDLLLRYTEATATSSAASIPSSSSSSSSSSSPPTTCSELISRILLSSSSSSAPSTSLCSVSFAWLVADDQIDVAEDLWCRLALDASTRAAVIETLLECTSSDDVPISMLERSIAFAKYAISTATSPASPNLRLALTRDLTQRLVETFGRLQDNEGTAMVLLLSTSQDVPLSENAFVISSQMLLKAGDYSLVLQMFENYLTHLDKNAKIRILRTDNQKGNRRASNAKTKKSVAEDAEGRSETTNDAQNLARNISDRIFTPALSALAAIGDLDMMMTLLLKEMPSRLVWPNDASFIVAINACRRAGRFKEGHGIFDICVAGPPLAMYDSLLPIHVAKAKVASMKKQKVGPAIINTVLACCAEGKLGMEALHVFKLISERGRADLSPQGSDSTSSNSRIGDEMRDLELIVTALSSPEHIQALPSLIDIITKSGSKPLVLTQSLHLHCVAAAIAAESSEVLNALLTSYSHDEAPEIDVLLQQGIHLAAAKMGTPLEEASRFVSSLSEDKGIIGQT